MRSGDTGSRLYDPGLRPAIPAASEFGRPGDRPSRGLIVAGRTLLGLTRPAGPSSVLMVSDPRNIWSRSLGVIPRNEPVDGIAGLVFRSGVELDVTDDCTRGVEDDDAESESSNVSGRAMPAPGLRGVGTFAADSDP